MEVKPAGEARAASFCHVDDRTSQVLPLVLDCSHVELENALEQLHEEIILRLQSLSGRRAAT